MKTWIRLWRDERGVVNSTDVILMTTIVGLGLVVGLVVLRNQLVQEFGDLGTAVGALDQGYEVQERNITSSSGEQSVAGSDYQDESDVGDGDDLPGQPPAGISITTPSPVVENENPGED